MKPVTLLVLLALASCGGGGARIGPEEIPAGVPVILNGFVNFYDTEPTAGHAFGIVNVTGQHIVALDVTDAAGTTTFPMYLGAGDLWLDEDGDVAPGFYLIRAHGQNGRTYARYVRYDADGSDAAYVSNANWEVGF